MTADGVRRALVHADSSFRFAAFSEIAFRICSEELYQQDMSAVISEFRGRSADHESLVCDLETALTGKADFLRSIHSSQVKTMRLKEARHGILHNIVTLPEAPASRYSGRGI